MNFATRASERRLYGISSRPLLDIGRVREDSGSETSARRTDNNDEQIRNVRQRLGRDDPIRVPLILDVASDNEADSLSSEDISSNESQEEEIEVITLTGADAN